MGNKAAAGAPGATSVRVAALAGAVFFVLIIIHANMRSGAPSATDPGREVVNYVTLHRDRLQLAAVLSGLAMCAALVWLSGLVRVVRKAEGRTGGLALVALAGGGLAAASTVAGALVLGTTATRIDDLDPAAARVWWTMFLLSTGATLLGLTLVIGATAVACLRGRLFARWFAVASILLALISLAGAFTIGYAGDGIQAVAGIAVLLDTAWILVVSIVLWRDPGLALP